MGGERNREQDGLSPFESKCCKDHVHLKPPESEANMEGNGGLGGKGQPPSPQRCHPSILTQPYLKQDPSLDFTVTWPRTSPPTPHSGQFEFVFCYMKLKIIQSKIIPGFISPLPLFFHNSNLIGERAEHLLAIYPSFFCPPIPPSIHRISIEHSLRARYEKSKDE